MERRDPLPARAAGFTLLELLVALAVAGILATLATLTLSDLLARHRLRHAAAAARLMLDEMRRDALRERRDRIVRIRPGVDWCLGVPGACGCTGTACMPRLAAAAHPGVRLTVVRPRHGRIRFDGVRGLATPARLVFASGDRRLELRLSLPGRLRVCDPEGGITPC